MRITVTAILLGCVCAPTIARASIDPNPIFVNSSAGKIVTFYIPHNAPNCETSIQGCIGTSRPGLDGQALPRSLDDVFFKRTQYVTLASCPNNYGKYFSLGTITYTSAIDNQKHTVQDVVGYVHDTGGAFPNGFNRQGISGCDKIDVAATICTKCTSDKQAQAYAYGKSIDFKPGSGMTLDGVWNSPSSVASAQDVDTPDEAYGQDVQNTQPTLYMIREGGTTPNQGVTVPSLPAAGGLLTLKSNNGGSGTAPPPSIPQAEAPHIQDTDSLFQRTTTQLPTNNARSNSIFDALARLGTAEENQTIKKDSSIGDNQSIKYGSTSITQLASNKADTGSTQNSGTLISSNSTESGGLFRNLGLAPARLHTVKEVGVDSVPQASLYAQNESYRGLRTIIPSSDWNRITPATISTVI